MRPNADSAPQRIMVVRCPSLCDPDTSPAGPQAARLFDRVIGAVTGFCPNVEAAEPGV